MLCVWSVFACFVSTAWAQNRTPEEQARQLFEDGRTHLAQGRVKQGIESLETVATSFGSTSYADDALLLIGQHTEQVTRDLKKAAEIYDQVAKKYPQGDAAPGAYFGIGRLALSRATTLAELEDAHEQFRRVVKLYPASRFVASALVASATALRRMGRFDSAIDAARRAALDFGSSEAAPDALYETALCLALAGEPNQALEDFQRIRNRYPESPAASRALAALTALYRLSTSRRFARDPAFSPTMGDVLKDVRAILMTPDRTLWIASDKTKSAVSFDANFKLGASWTAPDPESLSLSGDEVVFAARLGVKTARGASGFSVPSGKPGEVDPLDRITAAVALPSGDLLVADAKKKAVFRFSGTALVGTFPDKQPREVTRLAPSLQGEVWMLRKDNRTVEAFDFSGRPARVIPAKGPGYEFKKPVDIATDNFGNLYVAEEDQGVFLFSWKGAFLMQIGLSDIRRARAVTVEPSGAVLVYDDRAETIVRLK